MMKTFYNTRTVKSAEEIREIFYTFFSHGMVYLKYPGKDVRVTCYSCINGKVLIGFPYVKLHSKPVIIYTIIENRLIYLYLDKPERQDFKTVVFEVIKCCLIIPSRRSGRCHVSLEKKHRKAVYITRLISDANITGSFLHESSKVRSIFSYAETELRKHFSSVQFVKRVEASDDERMNYISSHKKGLVIRNIYDDGPEDREGYEFYMNNIFLKENHAADTSADFSEAVLPLTYRNKIAYGYLKVNKNGFMGENELKLAESFTESVEQYLLKLDIFPVSMERVMVSEVSAAGISVFYGEEHDLYNFTPGDHVCCDLFFPENNEVHLLSRVIHNSQGDDGVIHTGFKIEMMDEHQKNEYNGFVESLMHHGTCEMQVPG